MKLESAIELKRHMMTLARTVAVENMAAGVESGFAPLEAVAPSSAAGSVGVAFGVAPSAKGGKQFRVAVRVYGKASQAAHDVLRQMPRLSDDEIDIARGVKYSPRATLRAGNSCGHLRITAGTLGGFVEDDDNYYVLSNNHVLANSNQASAGDEIWQPGRIDVKNGKHLVIGHLDRWIPLSRTNRSGVDAAIARFSDAVEDFHPWHYSGIGEMKRRPVDDRFSVRRVIKRGRTTQVTVGQVTAINLDGVEIDYGTRRRPFVVTFDDQIEITHVRPTVSFCQGGDSGSFILDRDTLRPYALLYGGGPDDDGIDRTVAHFMPDVLQALNVRIIQ